MNNKNSKQSGYNNINGGEVFYVTDNKYLAEALSFLGIKYCKYVVGKEVKYLFKDTAVLRRKIKELYELKKN